MVEYGFYQAIYSSLYGGTTVMAAHANCLDGLFTGSNISGAGLTCDFISGLLVVGDIRDFLIQSYYLFYGEEGEYDGIIHTFASLGLVGTFAEATGAGITIDAALSGARLIPKVFKVDGKHSQFVISFSNYIETKILKVDDVSKQMELLGKIVPLLEITTAIIVYGDELKEIKTLLINAITDEDKFKDWARYTYGFFENIKPSDVVVFQQSDFSFFISSAHASGLTFATRNADNFIKILQEAMTPADRFVGRTDKMGKAFSEAIKQLNKAVDSGDN
jgi:hypothetical protein